MPIRNIISWTVLLAGTVYGAFLALQMLGTLFVVGDNDTALEVIGILAYGLIPVPASLLAVRYRWVAASLFTAAAILWAVGVVDSDLYLQKKFGHQTGNSENAFFLLKTSGVLLAFALFYVLTAWLKWPQLRSAAEKETA